MTDGTTGFQVAPGQEDAEMANIRSVFDKALNAVVAMSQLSKDVESLRAQVNDLTTQVTRLRAWNEQLDETLHHVRTERDTAQAEAKRLADEVSMGHLTIDSQKRELDNIRDAYSALQQKLHEAEQGRDTAELKVMDLEDKLRQAQGKLDDIRDFAKSFFPEPTPVPASPVQAWNEQATPVHIPITESNTPSVPMPETTSESDIRPWWEKEQDLNKPQFGS